MLAVARLFATDQGRDWNAYAALPQIVWTDPTPVERGPGVYFRQGTVLLRGFASPGASNRLPGTPSASEPYIPGQSGLTLIGSKTEVGTVAISKPRYSDDYEAILRVQFGTAAEPIKIADKCAPAPYDEGAGPGAFFLVLIPGHSPIYVRASQQAGGEQTPGTTVFELMRDKPLQAIKDLHCKPPE